MAARSRRCESVGLATEIMRMRVGAYLQKYRNPIRLYSRRVLIPALPQVLHDVGRESVPLAHFLKCFRVGRDIVALRRDTVPGHRRGVLCVFLLLIYALAVTGFFVIFKLALLSLGICT